MKKINSIKQLQPEKTRLKLQQEKLENKIQGNWNELKEYLKPLNIAKDTITRMIQNKTRKNLYGGNIIKSTFSYGVSLLAKRIADKAGKKLGNIFRKR